jgi:probable rRNA maturation factor
MLIKNGKIIRMEISVINKSKEKNIKKIKNLIKRIITATIKKYNVKFDEINIIFIKNNEMKKLNKKYLSKNSTTDVISFSYTDINNLRFADIFISTDMAKKNAKLYHLNPITETIILILHGLLHAIGFDDTTTKQKISMSQQILEILKGEEIWKK